MSEDNQGQSGKRRRRRRRRRSGKQNSGSKSGSNRKKSNRKSGGSSRKKSGRSSRKKSGRSSRNKRSGRNSGNRKSGRSGRKTKREKFGGREPVAEFERRSGPAPLTPFELFCLYYMGITEDNRYKRPSMGDAARRLNISPEDVEFALRNCGMDKHTLRDVDFDMSLAQLDVRVAPEGIDKREIARGLFEEFVEINPHYVDMSEEDLAASLEIDTD